MSRGSVRSIVGRSLGVVAVTFVAVGSRGVPWRCSAGPPVRLHRQLAHGGGEEGNRPGAGARRTRLRLLPGLATRGRAGPRRPRRTGSLERSTASPGTRVILMVRTVGSATPLTDAQRDQFCTYALNTVKLFPAINDVVIGNEAERPVLLAAAVQPQRIDASPGCLRGPSRPLLRRPPRLPSPAST